MLLVRNVPVCDKNNDLISLRPEGTADASLVYPTVIQRQRQKLYYVGQMFRREDHKGLSVLILV